MYEDLADLYTVIKATQHLEQAYVRASVSADDYTQACYQLIAQFKTTEKAIVVSDPSFRTDEFIRTYKMDCPAAQERLLVSGVPATVLHAQKSSGESVVVAAEATQWFISAMDALRLDQRAVDEVQPAISDLVKTLNKCESITPGFDKSKLSDWLVKLNGMRASEELSDDEVRQLLMDLDSSYANFKSALSTN